MSKIWLTSDLHFNHDKDFIWKARGFDSVDEMNKAIISRFNSVVKPEDTVYILGDVMMGSENDDGLKLLSALNGNKIIILGNHDTDRRIKAYESLNIPVYFAYRLKYKGYSFYLSHFPTLTSNVDDKGLKRCTINLFGHTHQTNNFFENFDIMYHVGVDSHNCYPIELDTIIEDIKKQVNKEKEKNHV